MNTTQTETDLLPALLALHAHGVTTILGAITLACAYNNGNTNPGHVAALVNKNGGGVSKGNLTGTFDTLEKNGVIVTRRGYDRRLRVASLTKKGAAIIHRAIVWPWPDAEAQCHDVQAGNAALAIDSALNAGGAA